MHFNYPTPYRSSPFSSPREKPEHLLKVTGEGKVSTSPNRAIITLGVQNENDNLTIAQKQNANTISTVISSLVNLGIPNEYIKTVEYRIEPHYDYKEGEQIFRGYRVKHLLEIKNDQIRNTGSIVDKAVQQGANIVRNIEFTVKDSDLYYEQALKRALQNAEQKAYTVTNKIGAQLNQTPVLLDEVSRTVKPVPFMQESMVKAEATPIQTGEMEIAATIRVEYMVIPY